MKDQIKVWFLRIVVVVILAIAIKVWGIPLYHQYFTPEKALAFVPTSAVKRGDFAVSFHEMGSLEAVKSVPVLNQVDGKIIKLAEDGKTIAQGDLIAELDTSDVKDQVRNAQLTYKNAQADVAQAISDLDILKASDKTTIDEAQADLDFAKTEFEQAKVELEKKKRLAKEKLIAGDQIVAAESDVRAKELAVTKQNLALVLQKKKCQSDENQKAAVVAKYNFVQALQKNALDDVTKKMNLASIKAPASGLVVLNQIWDGTAQRKLQEGDQARPRQIICTLPNLSEMQVKVKVGESDAPRVLVGMPVIIRMDSAPNRIFHGSVKDIASLARTASPWEEGAGRNVIDVTISVQESDPKVLKPGMKTDAEFICKSIKDTVYVPIESVIELQGKTYAFVKNGKSFARVPVQTGTANDSYVCITQGLTKGQTVALRDPSKATDQSNEASGSQDKESGKKKEQPVPIPGATKK